MSRISKRFDQCKERNEMALVCYLTAGYPDIDQSLEYLLACSRGGADVIEVGVPFSDPLADGPIIQFTSDQALKKGARPKQVLELVRRFRQMSDVPVVLMGYYNPVFRIGEDAFASKAKAAGADGLIVADLPAEESKGLIAACKKNDMDLIQLVAPTTSDERMRSIARSSSGYLYLVSRMGITGQSTDTGSEVKALIQRTKECAGDLPVAVGFGIAEPAQVRDLRMAGADAAIVGTALLRRIVDGALPDEIEERTRNLKEACHP